MIQKYVSASLLSLLVALASVLSACSSTPHYSKQKYADQQTSRTLEYEYDVVWKGIKDALSEFRLEEANAEEGKAVTEWVYSTSKLKYIEVKVNQQPRRKYLQTRYKFTITAKKQMIGTLVDVQLKEEVEKLNSDGSFKEWTDAEDPDNNRAHEMLKRIEQKVLSGRHV